jgi:triphosphatase
MSQHEQRGGRAAPHKAASPPDGEIELKLLGNAHQLADLDNLPSLARYQRKYSAISDADLAAIYYDTPGHALFKAGAVLRVRDNGEGRVMTLKRRFNGHGLERSALEADVSGMEPDFAVLSQILPARLYAELKQASLMPVFQTMVRRHSRMLETPLGIVEMAVDLGRITAGERSQAISEIELELKAGSPAAIYQLARELGADIPLRPSINSQSARGFDLMLNRAPAIVKADPVRFEGNPSLDQMLVKVLHSGFGHMMASLPAAEDGRNPEGIHQYRVALRRLRSVLEVIETITPSWQLAMLRDDARWLMSNLDDARAWDVFIEETMPPIAAAVPALAGLDALKPVAAQLRERAYDRARAAMTDPRAGRFQIALGLWIEQAGWREGMPRDKARVLDGPAGDFAAHALKHFRHKALKRGRHFGSLAPEERHRLRLAIKKLRYAAEYFLPMVTKGKKRRAYIRLLARLQEELGHYNDLAVVEEHVRHLGKKKLVAGAHRATGAMLGWQAAKRGHHDASLRAVWKSFRDHNPV